MLRHTIIIILMGLTACKSGPHIRKSGFPYKPGKTLSFDLSQSSSAAYEAEVVISGDTVAREGTLLLPVNLSNITNNIDIYSTAGSYRDFTLISYHAPAGANNYYAISSTADIEEYDGTQFSGINQPSDLKGAYIIKDGLQKLFVYNYDYFQGKMEFMKLNKLSFDSLDYIAVHLPVNAIGRNIEKNRTTVPDPIVSLNNTHLFIGRGEKNLKVKYEIPLSEEHKKWYHLVVKCLLLIFPAIVSLLFSSTASDERKKLILWIFLITQSVLLVVMFVLGYLGYFTSMDNFTDSIVQVVIAILGACVVYITSKKSVKVPPSIQG